LYDSFLLTVAKDIVMYLNTHFVIFYQCMNAVKIVMNVTPVLHVLWRD